MTGLLFIAEQLPHQINGRLFEHKQHVNCSMSLFTLPIKSFKHPLLQVLAQMPNLVQPLCVCRSFAEVPFGKILQNSRALPSNIPVKNRVKPGIHNVSLSSPKEIMIYHCHHSMNSGNYLLQSISACFLLHCVSVCYQCTQVLSKFNICPVFVGLSARKELKKI